MEVINKQSSRDPSLMRLVRQLVLITLQHNITFKARHIPGTTNILADAISRLQETTARRIHPSLDPTPTPIPTHWLPWATEL